MHKMNKVISRGEWDVAGGRGGERPGKALKGALFEGGDLKGQAPAA